jgi:hypothetical protein
MDGGVIAESGTAGFTQSDTNMLRSNSTAFTSYQPLEASTNDPAPGGRTFHGSSVV